MNCKASGRRCQFRKPCDNCLELGIVCELQERQQRREQLFPIAERSGPVQSTPFGQHVDSLRTRRSYDLRDGQRGVGRARRATMIQDDDWEDEEVGDEEVAEFYRAHRRPRPTMRDEDGENFLSATALPQLPSAATNSPFDISRHYNVPPPLLPSRAEQIAVEAAELANSVRNPRAAAATQPYHGFDAGFPMPTIVDTSPQAFVPQPFTNTPLPFTNLAQPFDHNAPVFDNSQQSFGHLPSFNSDGQLFDNYNGQAFGNVEPFNNNSQLLFGNGPELFGNTQPFNDNTQLLFGGHQPFNDNPWSFGSAPLPPFDHPVQSFGNPQSFDTSAQSLVHAPLSLRNISEPVNGVYQSLADVPRFSERSLPSAADGVPQPTNPVWPGQGLPPSVATPLPSSSSSFDDALRSSAAAASPTSAAAARRRLAARPSPGAAQQQPASRARSFGTGPGASPTGAGQPAKRQRRGGATSVVAQGGRGGGGRGGAGGLGESLRGAQQRQQGHQGGGPIPGPLPARWPAGAPERSPFVLRRPVPPVPAGAGVMGARAGSGAAAPPVRYAGSSGPSSAQRFTRAARALRMSGRGSARSLQELQLPPPSSRAPGPDWPLVTRSTAGAVLHQPQPISPAATSRIRRFGMPGPEGEGAEEPGGQPGRRGSSAAGPGQLGSASAAVAGAGVGATLPAAGVLWPVGSLSLGGGGLAVGGAGAGAGAAFGGVVVAAQARGD